MPVTRRDLNHPKMQTPAPTSVRGGQRHIAGPHSTSRKAPLPRLLAHYVLLLFLAFEVAGFWGLSPSQFGTIDNLRTTLLSESVLGILTLGILIPLIAGEFDVSLAMVLTVTMLVAGTLVAEHNWSLWSAFTVAVVVAVVIGTITGFLVVSTRAHSLIVSLGMMTLLRGITEALTEGNTINVDGENGEFLRRLSTSTFLETIPILLLVVVAIFVWFVTEMTPLGRWWYAVGGSKEGARLAGLRTDALRIGAFAAGGLLAGLAGVLQLSESTTATASFGAGFLFPAIAAAFLGAVAFRIGAFNVRGALTAIFVLAVGVTGIETLGAPNWIDGVFNGAALIVAVAVVRTVRGRG